MERELRGTWTAPVADSGKSDILIFHFTAWTEEDRLTGWSLELHTERCPTHVRFGPVRSSDVMAIDHVCENGVLVQGSLVCHRLPLAAAVVEASQLRFGFASDAMQSVLGTLVMLGAHEVLPVEPLPLEPPVIPIVRGEPVAAPVAAIQPAGRGGDLFPYVYMTLWPSPPAEELALGFATYPYPLDAAPSGELVQELARLRSAGGADARVAMERAAVTYLDSGAFVAWRSTLPAPFERYAEIQRLAAHAHGREPELVVAEIFATLGMTCEDAAAWLSSPAYAVVLASVWQGWFALVIELGFDVRQRDALARTLVADHVLRFLVGRCGEPVADGVLVDLARATLVLPAGIFPLPPSGDAASVSAPITPYAIGDLQMVQQRLIAYALGDIARVESVMPGERRSATHRTRRELERRVEQKTFDRTDHANEARAVTSNSEMSNAIADVLQTTSYDGNGFSITYGTGDPPTTKLSGGWSVETRPGPTGPSQSEVTRAARRVVEQAADRVARHVVEVRTTSRIDSSEEESISVLDNTAGTVVRRGIWRWLDEVYEATIVSHGNRLVFELMIAAPAASYVERDADLPASAYPPVPPPALGIESFADITPHDFPRLTAHYPSEALVLPPPPRRTVSGWARSGTPLTLEIPDGYVARTAIVSYVLAPGGVAFTISGVIGSAVVAIPVSATGASAPLAMHGETGAVQVLLMTAATASELAPVQLAVEIIAEPSPVAMDAWRLRTYQAIQHSYAAQVSAWSGGEVVGAASPVDQPRMSWRAVERRELQRGALDRLIQTGRERTGVDDPVGAPRELQFFTRMFAWDELSYRFLQGARGGAAAGVGAVGDARFLAFLEAAWAQVLLPVTPRDAMAVLYFLASGELWDDDPAWIPAHEADVALVNELRKLRPGAGELHRIGEPWEVVVPTTHAVLQDGERTASELRLGEHQGDHQGDHHG